MVNISRTAIVSAMAPIVLALGLTACGQTTADSSAVKVTNGVEIKESNFPSTVLLVMNLPEGQAICTGTFVNDSQVVTAGHCVEGLNKTNPSLFYAAERNGRMSLVAQAISYARNPQYSIDKGVSPDDVSVITFAAGTAPATTQIASASPAVGTEFTIVGYGNNANFNDSKTGALTGEGAGIKRMGTNTIASTDGGMLAFAGLTGTENIDAADKGSDVASGSGDSGGPMLVNNKLVGVTSGGGLSKAQDGTMVAISFYVDLNSPMNKAFLASALKSGSSKTAAGR